MSRGVTFGLLIALAACSRPQMSRAEYCASLSEELCTFYRRCGIADTDAGCAAILAPSNTTLIRGTCSLNGPPFEVAAAEACLGEVRAWGCDDQPRSICDPAARTVGAPCTDNCALGLTCAGPCGQKKCQAACKSLDPADCVPSAVGGPCTKGCRPGLRCVNGLCAEAPRIDETPCLFPSDCPWNSVCKYEEASGEHRCWAGSPAGRPCGSCLRGLVCSSDYPPILPGLCLRVGDVGETCDPRFQGRDCITGTTCFDGGCQKQNDEGGSCPCVVGNSCIDGRCVRERRPAGMECDTFAVGQCDDGLACLPSGDAGAGSCTPFTYTPPPQPMTCL